MTKRVVNRSDVQSVVSEASLHRAKIQPTVNGGCCRMSVHTHRNRDAN
jgi:hypothetical protein